MIYYYDKCPLRILYTDEEISALLLTYFASLEVKIITFSEISDYVLDKADKEHKLETEPNTRYNRIILTDEDGIRLSRILWDMILEKKIFLDFHRNPYGNLSSTDYVFIINS